jgi:type IX secretion system PorP/SprF family membrane protein
LSQKKIKPMKKTCSLFFAVIITSVALAQQDPLYTQYLNNPFVLNPAYAGITNNLNTSVCYRQQWIGFEGNPVTINANAHISLRANKMGAGLMIVSDKIGTTEVNEVYGSYSYRIKVADDKTLSFGLQAGVVNFKTDNSDLNLLDPNDPAFTGVANENKLSLGSGIILFSDRFFAGISVPRMLKARSDTGEGDLTLYTQHMYGMGSYMFFVTDRIRFRPSVLARFVSGAPASVDLNAAVILYDKYTAGLLTRNFTTYGVFLQAFIKDTLRLGYAMEIPTSKSVGSRYTSHEVTLGVRLSVLNFHENLGVTSY